MYWKRYVTCFYLFSLCTFVCELFLTFLIVLQGWGNVWKSIVDKDAFESRITFKTNVSDINRNIS